MESKFCCEFQNLLFKTTESDLAETVVPVWSLEHPRDRGGGGRGAADTQGWCLCHTLGAECKGRRARQGLAGKPGSWVSGRGVGGPLPPKILRSLWLQQCLCSCPQTPGVCFIHPVRCLHLQGDRSSWVPRLALHLSSQTHGAHAQAGRMPMASTPQNPSLASV